MARFRFKFDVVLRHRRIIEDEAQRELAKLLRQRMIMADQIRQMQDTITESRQALATGLTGRVDMTQVSSFASFSLQARARAQGLVERLSGLERLINGARQKLIAAARRRKAMELLFDRQREQWATEQNRREDAALDEMSVQSHAQKREL